ncbi:MAG: SHOCT domain-containing protein [Cellulomonas sp.]
MVLDRMPLDMMRFYGGGMGAGLWILMGLFWIGLIAAIIWLVIRLVPSHGRASGPAVQQPTSALPYAPGSSALESPVEILDRRFAHGELDLETYQAHRAALITARGGV